MFDAEELRELRAEWVAEFARQAIIILAPAREQDVVGSGKAVYREVGTVMGRIMSDSDGQKTEAGQQIRSVDGWEIRLPWGTEIKTIFRLRHGTTTYAVQTCDDGRADALFLSVVCTRAK